MTVAVWRILSKRLMSDRHVGFGFVLDWALGLTLGLAGLRVAGGWFWGLAWAWHGV
jgi:hypothetical protein